MNLSLQAVCLALLLSLGCTSVEKAASPAPEEIVTKLRERTQSLESLYAVVELLYKGEEREGTFTAVVHYQKPRQLRVTAFKEVLLSSTPIFDLALSAERYGLELSEDSETAPTQYRGASAELVREHPSFAMFYWACEALFLPGVLVATREPASGQVRQLKQRVEVSSRLSSGALVIWELDPKSYFVQRARINTGGGPRVRLRYKDYRSEGKISIPTRVTCRDGRGTLVRARLQELEVNPRLDPTSFRLPERKR